jgi:competence protein ComEC
LVGVSLLQGVAELPDLPMWPLMTASLLACLLAIRLSMRATIAGRLGAICVFLLAGIAWGFSYAAWRADFRLSDSLPQAWEGQDLEIEGIISGLPQLTERGTRFEFSVERVLHPRAIVPANVSLNWYTEATRGEENARAAPPMRPGERWLLTVRLRRPHGSLNPHSFDFEAFALERNIRATGYVRPKGANRKVADFADGFQVRIDLLRDAIRERMNKALDDRPWRGVLIALAIGEQNAIPADQWRIFWRTGVGHLMSISGLHITMIASLIYWMAFRIWARIPRLAVRIPAQRAAALSGVAMALSYSLIAGFSVPTQRTFFMLSAVAAALWTGRATSATRLLAFALVAVLLLDPWAVRAPGFWLSFGAVAAIFFVTSHRTGRPSSVHGALATQFAVTLGLLPLTLMLFQEVSLVSPVANAFAIPLISLVVVPITLIGALVPWDFPLVLAHDIMAWCGMALAWLASMPDAVWQSHAPPLWTVALAMAGVTVLMLPRGAVPRYLAVPLMVPMFTVLPPTPAMGGFRVALLDVGQGLATVVRTATHTLVYDTGPSWNPDSDSGNRIVVPYLRGEGLRKLDALIVTHDDDDHAGGARSIVAARDPFWVLTSLDPGRDNLTGAREVMRCEYGDAWKWDGVVFEILHPQAAHYRDEGRKTNNLGCVLKVTGPGGTLLMAADIEKKAEYELLALDPDALKADVLVIPHHGSRTSSTDAFLDAVKPDIALLSVGYRNRFRHPNAQVMARYDARRIPVYRTDREGAIFLDFSAQAGQKPALESYRRQYRRYWLDSPPDAEEAKAGASPDAH